MKTRQQLFTVSRWIFLICLTLAFGMCSKGGNNSNNSNPNNPAGPVDTTTYNRGEFWVTTGSQSSLLQKQMSPLLFTTSAPGGAIISVDSATKMQTIDGFGFTLTGASAYLINHLPEPDKNALLQELFGSGINSIGISYLRISIGASDLSANVFSYDDLAIGQTDEPLDHFSLSADTVDLIPLLQKIIAISPNIKILGSPWSPPVWMKSNNSSIGGSLLPQYYNAYANYFVKYIQQMKAHGINIDAVTIQNEPENPNNNPSLAMSATQQTDFIENNLGPLFQAASINTKIIIWDHNCDNPQYSMSVLNDAAARPFIDGTAFHLYAGDISALSTVHNAQPRKNLYFTEQWTSATGAFEGDFKWHLKNVIIGSMRNWSKNALEWNLANDPSYGPHTTGGCSECKGALTINGTSITRNVSYYIIAQASKFVPAGSAVISSNNVGNLSSVAFVTPAGKKVLLVLNEGNSLVSFNIKFNGKFTGTSLPASSAATYIW